MEENNEAGREQEAGKRKPSGTDLVIACAKDGATYFRDAMSTTYAAVRNGDHTEVVALESSEFAKFLDKKHYATYGKMPRKESVQEALRYFETTVDGPAEDPQLRVAKDADGAVWYDLCTPDWKCVRVTGRGWGLVPHSKPVFRRNRLSGEQSVPKSGGSPWKLLDFLTVPKEDRLLVMTYAISLLVPDIPHPLLLIHGDRGSSKSTFSKVVKSLVDPGTPSFLSMPSSGEELVRALNRSYFVAFDNLSTVTADQSDTLCRAVTGEGYVKRKLYSDNDDVVFTFRRAISLNGINEVANRPDLLDRSIPVLLERIPPEARKTEDEFWEAFGKAKPEILGGMFDVLSRALAISPTRPAELPRMADFAIWGHRIAEALGGFGPQFMKDYLRNEKGRNAYVLEDDIVAQSLVRFMATDSGGRRNWEGTPTELFKNLSRIAKLEGQDKYFPKSSSTFMKRLNEVRINLKDEGYGITTERGHEGRKIRIGRLNADGRPATPKEREPLPF